MSRRRVYTIGHGGLNAEQLVKHTLSHGVEYVIDVRTAPYSRFQPEFSRAPLSAFLEKHGLRYVYMGRELGGQPDDPNCYTDGRVDYDKCRSNNSFLAGMQRLEVACDQGLRVCLLCSEAKPSRCHRSKLIGAALDEKDIEVLHILQDGSTLTQDDVMRELTGGQGTLFGHRFVSRKSYPQP